jgi:hypothetical protein
MEKDWTGSQEPECETLSWASLSSRPICLKYDFNIVTC